MAFSGIYFNNKEYNEMWFEGNRLWQKGEIDYSQRINLEQVGSKYSSQQYDLRFKDDNDYASPYWVSFSNNAGTYIKSGISIPIPNTVNAEYALVKGIMSGNVMYSTFYIEGANTINFTLGEEVSSYQIGVYYEFEALISIKDVDKISFYIYRTDSLGHSCSVGDITIEPIVSTTSTYAKITREANYPYIRSITLESSLTDTTIIQGTTFTITPTVLPTNYVGDEIVVTYDTNYLSYDGTTFTVLDTAMFGEETTITYSSKLNPSASATYTIKVKEYVPITSIVLSHNLDIPLTDVPIHTTFTITPIIEPSDYTLSDLQVVYNSDYLITDDNMTFTILEIAEGQVLDIAYMGKTNSIVKSISLTVSGVAYPYPEVDSVVTYVNTSSSAYSKTFKVIDSTLPYSINGVETTSFSFPPNVETQVKLVNLKPCYGGGYVFPIKYEQLRIPNLTDLSDLFYYFAYHEEYEHSWQPQYFELTTNPTSMRSMFMGCKYLTDEMMEQFKPHLKAFNTSQITDMSYVFNNCLSLTELDMTNFDMTNVVNKNAMLTGFDGTIRVNKDKWLSDTYHCSYGATDATFILVDELGAEEEVYKPLYRTEFGATANLPTWVSKFSSNTYDFDYSSGYYIGNVTNYYDADASTTFRVVAPITGDLIVYTSAYKNTQHDSLTIKSNGSQVAQYKYYETEYIYSSKYKTTSIPVVEGQEYLIQLDYVQGMNDRYGNTYLHGFSVDHYVVTSISLSHNIEDITDVTLPFVITPTITTTGLNGYHSNDLEIIYDENYISVDSSTNLVTLLDGGQGQTVSITYRSKTDNSISDTITVTLGEYSGVSTGGLQPLKEWKSDLVPLEWDSLYTNYRTANATVTYNLEERSAKISATAKYNSYATIGLKIGDNYTSIFDSTKYYKLSYKVRGKDTNGYSSYSSYSSLIYDGSTYIKYTNADNLLDETEWREENYVVYGITQFSVRCTYGESKNWIEIKDVMYQVYDEAPALPDVPLYQVASNEFSLVNMYKDGLATASSKYNTITVDDVNDYFTIKVNTNAKVKYMSASLSLPIGRFYTISGLGACRVSTGSNPMLWSLYNYESDSYSLKNVGALTMSTSPDVSTENMKEVYMEEDKTNINYLKNIYSRSLNGVFVRYIGFWLDSNVTTDYFIKFANLTIKEQE